MYPSAKSAGANLIKALVASFFISLFAIVSILHPMCVPQPSGMPLKPMMPGISSLGNVIPSSSLKEKLCNSLVLLIVANNCGTLANVPGMKFNSSPWYGREKW